MDASRLDVLIVDDHEPMRTLMRKILDRASVGAVREAASAEAALAMLAERRANLVLLDQSMPGMSGLDLMRAIRADAGLADTRLIMLTGHANALMAEAAREAGADAMLVKPVGPGALLNTIAAVVVRPPRAGRAASPA